MALTKILLVDEDLDSGTLLKAQLEAAGKFNVFWAKSGEDAVRMAKAFIPDLALLEVTMSDMPGEEIARQLKNDLRTEKIPIVFLTAAPSSAEREPVEFQHNGQPHYLLRKPINVNEVLRCIKDHLR